MSNRVTIQPTIFSNYPAIPPIEESYGVRVFDDYGSSYTNFWNRSDLDLPPISILKKVLEEGQEEIQSILSDVRDRKMGVEVGDEYLPWEDIESVFEEKTPSQRET